MGVRPPWHISPNLLLFVCKPFLKFLVFSPHWHHTFTKCNVLQITLHNLTQPYVIGCFHPETIPLPSLCCQCSNYIDSHSLAGWTEGLQYGESDLQWSLGITLVVFLTHLVSASYFVCI